MKKDQTTDVVEEIEETTPVEIITDTTKLEDDPNRPLLEYMDYVSKNKDNKIKGMFEYCVRHNLYFDYSRLHSWRSRDLATIFSQYMSYLQNTKSIQDRDFYSQLDMDMFVHESLDEETKKNRMTVMDILSYDPFKDDEPEDKPQLYRDLSKMLTEGMRKDVAKARAAISIVRNYSNIDKYQKIVNTLMGSGHVLDESTQKTVDQALKLIKTMQDSINTTADKNNFTVKGVGNSGKGMLSDVMNQVNLYGIDEGVTNYYDIATSQSIAEIANISFKAQLNQVNLSKTDYADIIATQAEIVKDSQEKARQAVEALRICREKIKKQELIEELEEEYRHKGIEEDEIQEFIDREYKMFELGNK